MTGYTVNLTLRSFFLTCTDLVRAARGAAPAQGLLGVSAPLGTTGRHRHYRKSQSYRMFEIENEKSFDFVVEFGRVVGAQQRDTHTVTHDHTHCRPCPAHARHATPAPQRPASHAHPLPVATPALLLPHSLPTPPLAHCSSAFTVFKCSFFV